MPNPTHVFAGCKYLHLDRLFEPSENQLAMRVLEATDDEPVPAEVINAEPVKAVRNILAHAQR